MITTVSNGTQYNELTQAIIDWHKENNQQIAWVTRPLEFTQDDYGIPQLITEITTEEINAGTERIRQFYYTSTTDPLFFKAQRGEATVQEWLDAVAAVKAEYPKI
jgi:hypothetical protein